MRIQEGFGARSASKGMRSGLATLEFVLVLPFLLLFSALIFKTGELMLKKTDANVQSRVQAQSSQQFQVEGAPFPAALRIEAGQMQIDNGTFGVLDVRAAKTINYRPVLNVSEQVPGRYLALGGAWDSKSISFPQPQQGVPFADRRAFVLAAIGGLEQMPFFEQLIGTDKTSDMQQLQTIGQDIISNSVNITSVTNGYTKYSNLTNQFQNPTQLSGDILTVYQKRQQIVSGYADFFSNLNTLQQDFSSILDQNSKAFRDD